MDIRIKKLLPEAVIPKYSIEGDACLDLTAITIKEESELYIEYGTGLAMEIPKGFVGLVFPRSSVTNKTLMLKNCTGIIDSNYRGEIKCRFYKTGRILDNVKIQYNIGDRVAQIMILPRPEVLFIESDILTETDRGTGGYGSTGK